MEIAAIWRELSGAVGPLAFAALWQGAVVALGLALCLRLAPALSAADRFRAWAAGFAVLVALPFLPALVSLLDSMYSAPSFGAAAPAQSGHPWFNLDPRWSLGIAAVWIAASLVRAADLAVHAVRLRRLWQRATPIDATAVRGGLALPARIGRGDTQICATRELDRPSVIGFFAPRILIPEWLLSRLTPAELEQVVLHEAEHLRRRDDWINLAQKLCLIAFPLNPALAWMERRLCREREMACDEGVVRRTGAPRAYAACLASLAERGLERRSEALSLGAWRRRPELAQRVHRILRLGPGLHPAAARALLGVVGCGLIFGAVELARCPQLVAFAAPRAQQQEMADAVMRPEILPGGAARMVDARGNSLRGFQAVEAVARVPSRAELAEMRKHTPAAARWSRALAAENGRDVALSSASTNSAHAAADSRAGKTAAESDEPKEADLVAGRGAPATDNGAPQQVIVFSAWEQVETTTSAASAKGQPGASSQIVRRYTVTRLLLRVDPSAGPNKTASGKTPKQAASKSGAVFTTIPLATPPAAIPIRDGWLVIQL